MSVLKVACIQLNSGEDVAANLATITDYVRQARAKGAGLIALPENAVCMPSNGEVRRKVAVKETVHPAIPAFSELAKETGAWLLVGSIAVTPEPDDGKLRNRSFLFNPQGQIVGRYDKIHLFDADPKPGESYRESDDFQGGAQAVVAQLPQAKLGMTVCYDLRFPLLYNRLAQAGANILAVPAAFAQTTGEAHWHVLLRARAIETGSFVIAPAQTGKHASGRNTYGHSLVVAPWGEIIAERDSEPGVLLAELDMNRVAQARKSLNCLQHVKEFINPLDAN